MVRARVPRVHQRGSLYPIVNVERKIPKLESNEITTHDSPKDNADTNSLKVILQPITSSNEIIKDFHEESPISSPDESIEEFPLTPQSESMEEVCTEKIYKRRELPSMVSQPLNELAKEETRKRRRTSIAGTLPYEQLISFDGAYESQRIEEFGGIEEPLVDPIVEQHIQYMVPFPSSSFNFEYQQELPLPIQTSFIEPIQYLERISTLNSSNEVEPPKSPLKHGDVFLTDWPDTNNMELGLSMIS
ncbi:3843_t:CDS:2 [Dentiscutata heterogama]|uniref:3843_t:CDS:1 n=1 Tax=Dentiscutata heterogama TaxID=1316150 RepID=A0ACA9LD55_9GLOM|nr:3843_t:CDS:2 [Dentiscutata heterogama]